jgi:2-haloalkanoic acid dehalogenase type II
VQAAIDWSKIRVLSFDCYGTLIDWEKGILTALSGWVERFGVSAVLAGFGACEPDIEHAHPNWPYRRVIAEVYRQMALEFGYDASDEDALKFAISVGAWPPFEDTLAALTRLAKRFDLAILSNVDEVSISGTLAHLEVPFIGVYTAEAVGAYKPDLRNFAYLLDRMAARGIARNEIVHVAQSLYHDHVPAKQIGLQTVWVDRTSGRSGAAPMPSQLPNVDYKVQSLKQLADHIDHALRSLH